MMKPKPQKITEAPASLFSELQFSFATYQFNLQALESLYLPQYKGSAFRGGFGHVFKKVCCTLPGGECRERCQLPQVCAYAYIFETPSLQGENAPIQATNLPHPFVLLPPTTKREHVEAGEKLSFQLTLIGKAMDFMPYFVYAFDELGRTGLGRERGKYFLENVCNSRQVEIYDGHKQILKSDGEAVQFADLQQQARQHPPKKLTLQFITPTRIVWQNKLIDRLPFELLIRNLLRRASLLAKIHSGQEWALDYAAILESARNDVQVTSSRLRWYDWERYSNRQKRRMTLGGFIGQVTYEGKLAPFLPLILLGQSIHIGKNTTFGMGKYELM